MSLGSEPTASSPIAPMAHGDLHRLTLPHLLRYLPLHQLEPRSAEVEPGASHQIQPLGARSNLDPSHPAECAGIPPRVLDLGAGSGSMSQLLHTAGYCVEACDLEPELFQFPAVTCRRADLTMRLPYDDAAFDGVVCVEVLEHLDGHERLFREIQRILKPRGAFLFTTPNVMSIKSRLSFLWTGFPHSFYPLEVGEQSPQQWHISGYGGNRYRFVLGLAGLELREIASDKFSRTSLAFA